LPYARSGGSIDRFVSSLAAEDDCNCHRARHTHSGERCL